MVSNGLKRGLAVETNVLNMALGGTTSVQNIFGLVRAREKMSTIDAIVTESNLNDAHAIHNAALPVAFVKENIKKLYRELALTGKPVVAIMMTARQYDEKPPPKALIAEIKSHHMAMANRYGVATIDLDGALAGYTLSHTHVRKIMPDAYHPVQSFMYELGHNIGRYVAGTKATATTLGGYTPNFRIVTASDLSPNICNRHNSYFNEDVVSLTHPVEVDIGQERCVAIATWPDDTCELHLSTRDTKVVMQMANRFALNELVENISGRLVLSSNMGKTAGITQKSINVRYSESTAVPAGIVALLIEKQTVNKPKKTAPGPVLDHLLPPPEAHVIFVERLLFALKDTFQQVSFEDIVRIRSAAVKLENLDLKEALRLMEVAARHRPDGPYINARIKEYKEKLQKPSQRWRTAVRNVFQKKR